MPDVRLKEPKSDFVFVTGDPIEAAQLRTRGYTDVSDEPSSETPESSAPGAPSGNADASSGGTSTPTGTDGNTGDSTPGDAQGTTGRPTAAGKGAGARR